MAIRKFRSKMKPIVIVITIAFVLSSLIAAYYSWSSQLSNKNYAFKINGEKVSMVNIARDKNLISSNMHNRGNEKFIEILSVNMAIENELIKQMADKLKIKISSSDVKKEYRAIEAQIKNKEQFRRMLVAQGYTKKTFKKALEENLKRVKLLEYFNTNMKISDEEILEKYNQNKYTFFADVNFDSIKENLKKNLSQKKGSEAFARELQIMKNKMKLTDIREKYNDFLEKEEMEEENIKITNVDFANIYMELLKKDIKSEEAEKEVLEIIKNEINILIRAKQYGVNIDNNLPLRLKVQNAYEGLFEKLKSQENIQEKELIDYFEENKKNYATYPSVDAYISILNVEPSEEDKEVARKKASELMKNLTVNNFSDVAKKESEDGSSEQGGDLGWFSKGQMVPEFEKAAFEGKKGEIYPEIIETKFGEHIIYVADKDENRVRASHILVKTKVSIETIKNALEEVKRIASKISKNEIDFKDLPRDKYTGGIKFEGIKETGYIQGLGFNQNLINAIYKAPLNKVDILEDEDNIFIFQKTEEKKYKAATFEEVKEKVEADYKSEKAMEKLKEILKN